MTTKVKAHYENHLAQFYSWMMGDFDQKRREFENFLHKESIYPTQTKCAIDLGAGNGIQSIALKNLSFDVTAVDFNNQLLNELKSNREGRSIKTVNKDIRNVTDFRNLNPELIICCGDTITHLDSIETIEQLITDCNNTLVEKGKLILAFRDYSTELSDEQRFIPVKNDENRILTCILDYNPKKVKVTDLFYEKTETGWIQKVSSYEKVRIFPHEVVAMIEKMGMTIIFNQLINRMNTIVAQK